MAGHPRATRIASSRRVAHRSATDGPLRARGVAFHSGNHKELYVRSLSKLVGYAALPMVASAALAGQTITVVEHPVNETTIHTSRPGVDAVGDILSFANAVFYAANKVQVAKDQGFCVRTEVGKS